MPKPPLKKFRVTPPGKVVEATDTADARRVATGGSSSQPPHVTVEKVQESDLRETVQKTEKAAPEKQAKPKRGA